MPEYLMSVSTKLVISTLAYSGAFPDPINTRLHEYAHSVQSPTLFSLLSVPMNAAFMESHSIYHELITPKETERRIKQLSQIKKYETSQEKVEYAYRTLEILFGLGLSNEEALNIVKNPGKWQIKDGVGHYPAVDLELRKQLKRANIDEGKIPQFIEVNRLKRDIECCKAIIITREEILKATDDVPDLPKQ